MPVIKSAPLGWRPRTNESEEADMFKSIKSPPPLGPLFQSLDTLADAQSSPIASTSSADFNFYMSPADPGYKKMRDPSWVPRPRNAFIIFRCQYSRDHTLAKDGNASRAAGAHTETLSKRAADAWKLLSPAEQNVFKRLAAEEKEEHARRNPNYRFRPMKRPTSRPRKSHNRSVSGRHQREEHREEHREEPPRDSTPADVLRRWEQATPAPPRAEQRHGSPQRMSTNMSVDPSVKAGRRRSSSVPVAGTLANQYPTSFWLTTPGLQKAEVKRSRSATGRPISSYWDTFPFSAEDSFSQSGLLFNPGSMSASMSQASSPSLFYDCYVPDDIGNVTPELLYNEFAPSEYTPDVSLHGGAPDHDLLTSNVEMPNNFGPSVSPLTVVASSLMHWNNIPEPTSVPRLPYSDPTALSPSDMWNSPVAIIPSEQGNADERVLSFSPSPDEGSSPASAYPSYSYPWGCNSSSTNLPVSLKSRDGTLLSERSYPAYSDEAQALMEYGKRMNDIGLTFEPDPAAVVDLRPHKQSDPEPDFSELFRAL